jgi:hypothetical protein
MQPCPPHRTCSRHHDGPPDTTGHTRTTQAKSGGDTGNDRTAPATASRGNFAAGTPFGGTSGETDQRVRGISPGECATLPDRDPDQAAHRTPHEHQLVAARRPSHQHHPRDSIENPDSHRQNAGVESGVTREHTTHRELFRGGATPWLHGANPLYAYREKLRGGRDVLQSDSTRLPGTSGSRPSTKTSYTRRAETPPGRAPRGPLRARRYPMQPANPVEVQP